MSKQECHTADWYQIGYSDAVDGRLENRIDAHRKACAKANVTIGFDDYRTGWAEGINKYCTAENGKQVGSNGRQYNGQCPAELAPGFLETYQPAYKLYKAEFKVKSLQRDLRKLQDDEKEVREEMAEHQFAMVNASEKSQRLYHLEKVSELKSELSHLQRQQAKTVLLLATAKTELAHLQEKR